MHISEHFPKTHPSAPAGSRCSRLRRSNCFPIPKSWIRPWLNEVMRGNIRFRRLLQKKVHTLKFLFYNNSFLFLFWRRCVYRSKAGSAGLLCEREGPRRVLNSRGLRRCRRRQVRGAWSDWGEILSAKVTRSFSRRSSSGR